MFLSIVFLVALYSDYSSSANSNGILPVSITNPLCSNGVDRSVSKCMFMTNACFLNYVCENGYCCPPTPLCPNGIQSTASCIGGVACNSGLNCITVGTKPVCCRACPNNAASSGVCTSNTNCKINNTECNLFNTTQGLCCPKPAALCPDGSLAAGTCFPGAECGTGLVCSPSGYCCLPSLCTDGSVPIGNCFNGLCGLGFTCNVTLNICCAT